MQNPTYQICNGVHFLFRGIKSDAQNSDTMNRSFSPQRYIHCKSLTGYVGKKIIATTEKNLNLQDLSQVETVQGKTAKQNPKFILTNTERRCLTIRETLQSQLHCQSKDGCWHLGCPGFYFLTMGCISWRTQAFYMVSTTLLWGPGYIRPCQIALNCCVDCIDTFIV